METVFQELDLDLSGFEQKVTQAESLWDKLDTRSTRMGQQSPFRKQTDDLLKFNNQLKSGGVLFDKLEDGPKGLKVEIARLSAEYVKLVSAQGNADKGGSFKDTEKDIERVKKRLAELQAAYDLTGKKKKDSEKDTGGGGGSGKKEGGLFGSILGKASGALGALGIGVGAVSVLSSIKDITAEFQKYEAVLTNTLGSQQRAAAALQTIQTFAANTPFSVAELTESFVKLANQGFVPTENELRQLGDLAASTGKPFDQLAEAILDAQQGEFERLKEFGVKARKAGDEISFSFKGQTTTVKNTEEALRKYILSLGDLKGVSGSMAAISGTLTGQLSNLGDTTDSLFLTIGKKLAPVFTVLIGAASAAINGMVKLFKTLEPAVDSLFQAFEGFGKSVGGVFDSFGSIINQSTAVSTAVQKVGYVFEKALIIPFKLVVLATAEIAEAFNILVIVSRLAAAKLSGNDSLVGTLNQQLDESKKRLAELREDFKRTKESASEDLDDYARRDNQRKRREERRARLDAEGAAPDAPKPKPADTPDAKAKAESDKRAQALLNAREKQKQELEKLNDELAKLQAEADKQKLEQLDKTSAEYLELKRKTDLAEIEAERAKLIELGKAATGTPVYDPKLKKVVIKANEGYTLPQGAEDLLQTRRDVVNQTAGRDLGRQGEEQFEKDKQKQRKDFADAEAAYDKEQAKKREDIARKSNELQLNLRQALYDAESGLIRKAGESEQDFEKRKNAELLAIRLKYYEDLLRLAEADPTAKDQILGLKETLAGIRKEIDTTTAQAKTGPQDLFDLLGITFDPNAEKNDQIKAVVSDTVKTVLDGANQILDQQLTADQARIDSIDRQIAAKQAETQIEATLAAAGLANSLDTKKKESAALAEERKKAVDAQRRDQTIQIGLNLLLQESNMALAVAKLIAADSKFGIFGVIAAGVSIAAMIGLFASSIAQISSLPKFHDGDEVTQETARRRRRNLLTPAGPDEVDARLQVGEGVTRKESYQPNRLLFSRLNKLGRKLVDADLTGLLEGTGVNLPDAVKNHDLALIQGVNEGRGQPLPDYELHRRVDKLSAHMETLIADNRRFLGTKETRLPDGRIRTVDAHGNVSIGPPR